MTFRVIIQPPAQADIEETYRWIAKSSPQSAATWYNGLIDAIETLTTLPHRCPLAPENDAFEEEIRQLLYGKRGGVYRILFTLVGETVRVLHVRYGARRYLTPEEK